MNIHKKIIILVVLLSLIGFCASSSATTTVKQFNNRMFIQDRIGEEWEVSEAEKLGFKPEKFQYGIGRNAFTPLDDKRLTTDDHFVSLSLRVIGIVEDGAAQAYSVPRLSRHETANSMIADLPITVAY